MSKDPKTLPEWKTYAESLKGEELFETASSANSMRFVKTLKEEGYSPEEIHTIIHLIARRFIALGERPPMDGLYDLGKMGREPAPISV